MPNYYLWTVGVLICWRNIVVARDGICLGEHNATVFAYPDNTSLYIECQNEVASLSACPAFGVFDPIEGRCVIADDTSGSTVESTTITTSTSISSTTTPSSTTTSSTTISPRTTTTETTSTGTYSSPPTTPPSTTTTGTTSSFTTTTTTTTASPISASTTSDEIPLLSDFDDEPIFCSCNNAKQPTYHASKRQCDKFYLCFGGSRPFQLSCCRGHHWSQTQQSCIPEYKSQCGRVQTASITPVVPDCPARGHAFYPHPSVCEYFYYCENGIKSLQQCEAFYHWDFFQQRCIIKSVAKCYSSGI